MIDRWWLIINNGIHDFNDDDYDDDDYYDDDNYDNDDDDDDDDDVNDNNARDNDDNENDGDDNDNDDENFNENQWLDDFMTTLEMTMGRVKLTWRREFSDVEFKGSKSHARDLRVNLSLNNQEKNRIIDWFISCVC